MNKNVKINNPTLVDAWRQSDPQIVQFWWAVDHAVTEAVKYKHTTTEYGLIFTAAVACFLSHYLPAETWSM